MNEIRNLITLMDSEEILGVFPHATDTKISVNHLDPNYHNLEELPSTFFQIIDNKIVFKYVKIITNLRILIIGLNFWQLYDISCKTKIGTFDVNNYILNIDKKFLTDLKIKIDLGSNVFSFNDIVNIRCLSNKEYQKVYEIVSDNWDLQPTELFTIQTEAIDSYFKNLTYFLFFQIMLGILIMIAMQIQIHKSENYHFMVVILFYISIIMILFSSIETFFVVLKKTRDNIILSIPIKLLILIFFLLNLLVMVVSLPFFR